jgi:hypothetical protein
MFLMMMDDAVLRNRTINCCGSSFEEHTDGEKSRNSPHHTYLRTRFALSVGSVGPA